MESGVKRTQRDYTLAFKLSLISSNEPGYLESIKAR